MWTILLFQVFLIPLIFCERDAKPVFQKSKMYYAAKVGRTVRLKCMLANSTRATIKWTKDGANLGKNDAVKGDYQVINRKTGGLLRIKNIKKKDAGEYVCKAVNKYGSASRKLNLTVKGEDKKPGVPRKGKPWFIKPPVSKVEFLAWPASSDIKFKCEADGERPISYKWFKNGNSNIYRRLDPKMMNTTRWYLRIKTAVPSDNGVYTCVVSNRLGNISKSIKFTVLEKERRKPILSIGFPKNKTVKSGSNVTFECRESISSVLIDYRWLKWNKLPKNYPRIHLHELIPNYNSSDYRLINPNHYKAFKVRDINDQQLYGGRVILQNVSKEDAGLYTCLVSNYIGSASRSAFLIIDDKDAKPVFQKSTMYYTARVGQTVRLKCLLANSTRATIKWRKDGVDLVENDAVKGRYQVINRKVGGVLKIKNTEKKDAGEYVCKAVNKYGSASRKLNLTVKGEDKKPGVPRKGKPWFIKPPVSKVEFLAWPASSDIKFKCEADGERPISYKWFKNGKSNIYRRLDPKMNTTRRYLRIKTAIPADNGVYTCVVSNRLGNISRSIKFTVLEKGRTRPILTIGYPKNKTVKSGSDVTFECRELVSPALTDYRWLKWNKLPKSYPRIHLNESIQNSNSSVYRLINPKHYRAFTVKDMNDQELYGGRVILQNVSKEDAGLYTCFVSNHIGSTWKSAFLIIVDKEPTIDSHEPTAIPINTEERVEIKQSNIKFIIILTVLCIVIFLIFASVATYLSYYRRKANKRKEGIAIYDYQNVAQDPRNRLQNEYIDMSQYKT